METYGIYEYKEIPPDRLAVLAIGLRDNSRIKMKLGKSRYSPEVTLLAGIIDRLNLVLWAQSKDGLKGINRPKPILSTEEKDVNAFMSGEDFERERQRIIDLIEAEKR